MLTQEQLAEQAGLSVRTVRYLEAGQHSAPRPQTRRLLVAALGALTENDGFRPVPAQLPADSTQLVGRNMEVQHLDDLRRNRSGAARRAPMLVVLVGPVGVGKTALAVHWAHRSRSSFTDGQIFLDLRGSGSSREPVSAAEGLSRVLQALGVPQRDIPDDVEISASLYRTMLADRRVLVVLDDAANVDQVRPLVPGGPRNAVVVTSRDDLNDFVVREGATRIYVDGLTEDNAWALIASILDDDRASAERGAVATLAQLCGYRPLALRLVATALKSRPEETVSAYTAAIRKSGLSKLVGGSTHVTDLQALLESL
jgi:transcriptional regulator with XRE-family HTH domain